MKPSQIRKSIQSRHLHLEGMDRFTHFEPALYPIVVAGISLALTGYRWSQDGEIGPLMSNLEFLALFTLIPTILAVVLFAYQVRQLRLKRIITVRSIDESREIVVDIAKQNNWQIRNNRKSYMRLQTEPSFWSGSWGEQITLFLDGRDIWINSICDPAKRASIVSMGRNKQNVEILACGLSS